MAKTSIFCTGTPRPFGFRGGILHEKRGFRSESAWGDSTGQESGRPGLSVQCDAHPPASFRGRCAAAGIPPGGSVTSRWRRAGLPCSCMPWTLAGARLTRGDATSGLVSSKAQMAMEACTICSRAMTWGVKIAAGHMSIASHTPHPGKLTCRSSRRLCVGDGDLTGRPPGQISSTCAPAVMRCRGDGKMGGLGSTC